MSVHVPMLMNLFFMAVISAASQADAQSSGAGIVAGFKGTAVNLEGVAGETITIDIRKWSSDEDRTKVFDTFSQGADKAAEGMSKSESVGYVWRSGSGVGHSIRYAFDTKRPDGGQRVVLVTTDNLNEWNRRPGPTPPDPAPPLTVIELRLPAKGAGEGKFSAKIGADGNSKLLTIEGYDTAPVVFTSVTRAKE